MRRLQRLPGPKCDEEGVERAAAEPRSRSNWTRAFQRTWRSQVGEDHAAVRVEGETRNFPAQPGCRRPKPARP